jgi:YYY domain-containing protein
MTLFGQFLAVYLVVQVITVAALPLSLRFFAALPDRGYVFARLLGILLTGYLFWIGYSIGILRNEIGGAWLALVVVAVISVVVGRKGIQRLEIERLEIERLEIERLEIGDSARSPKSPISNLQSPISSSPPLPLSQSPNLPPLPYILLAELLFLLAFAAWAWVRAHDPAADHTEQPMDLMFMHSIRASLTYPPQDAWLAGYPISYYYFGYWLMNMVGLMAGQTAAVSYNLAQALWFGLLLIGAFGVGYNLVAAAGRRFGWAAGGGLIAALLVGLSANVQGLLEWLYANGVDVSGIAALLKVRGFPENAAVTHNWYIDFGWWWWRSSRVLSDVSLRGDHIEVIDEFPAFSYILGDNHPHVAAMPFAILAIGVALAIVLGRTQRASDAPATTTLEATTQWLRQAALIAPLGWGGFVLTAIVVGSLLFLNTWDYPPYWLLLTFSVAAAWMRLPATAEQRPPGMGQAIGAALGFGVALAGVGFVLYLPYFLTAQSQAGGLIPNFFHPTRFSQYVAMFGIALLTLTALLVVGWSVFRPRRTVVIVVVALIVGLPLVLLALAAFVATSTDGGRALLAGVALPDGATSHLPFMVERWISQPFTFLVVGLMTAVALALLWTALQRGAALTREQLPMFFALALAAIGLGLTLTPEIVYLRDNFGWRMNTIFKFYYQAWLLFGLAGAFTIALTVTTWRGWRVAPALLSSLALVLATASTVYIVAGAYSKTQGFSRTPTFDAAAYLATISPAEYGAVEWVRANTRPDDVVVEGKGRSYGADTNRISTMTGRPTPLGWDGHESQWRGRAYGAMAAGRPEALRSIYGGTSPSEVVRILQSLGASYLYVGPSERAQYGLTPAVERALFAQLELVYPAENPEQGDVRIYRVP